MEAEQIVSDARADADIAAAVANRQLEELERQRDSVASYLEEMRGVLGGALPQAPALHPLAALESAGEDGSSDEEEASDEVIEPAASAQSSASASSPEPSDPTEAIQTVPAPRPRQPRQSGNKSQR